MFLNWSRSNEYFCVIQASAGGVSKLNPKVLSRIKRYFWWRGKKIGYFEPLTTKVEGKTYVVVGTPNNPKIIPRTSMIFLLELYAHLEDPSLPITNDFEVSTLNIDDQEILIYKIPRKLQ